MPAVNVLQANGEWVRGQSNAQTVANFIAAGADVYDLDGNKLPLVYFNRTGIDPAPNNNPDVWNVQVQGGLGPQGSMPLADYLGKPSTVEFLTNTGSGITPVDRWSVEAIVDAGDGGGGLWGTGGDGAGSVASNAGAGALAVGLLALAFVFGKKRR